MEALQQIDGWRQEARITTIVYCESDDILKQNTKDMAVHRKNKKEAREKLMELLQATKAPGFNINERGYHVNLTNRKSKKAVNAHLLRSRCLEWQTHGGSGEDLFEFLTSPVIVEQQSLQRSAKPKGKPRAKKGKTKQPQPESESDSNAGEESEDDEQELEEEDN